MKKVFTMMMITTVLLTSNVALAQAATTTTPRTQLTQAASDYKAKLAEITPLLEKIRANRTEILKLRADARVAYNNAKSNVKKLIQNKDNLTSDQIEALKASLNVLKQDKQALGDTIGDISSELPDLRAARQNRDTNEVKNSLNGIIAVQNTRITELNQIITDLNKVAAM